MKTFYERGLPFKPEILFWFNHCGWSQALGTLCLFVHARMLSFPTWRIHCSEFYALYCMNSPRWNFYQLLLIILLLLWANWGLVNYLLSMSLFLRSCWIRDILLTVFGGRKDYKIKYVLVLTSLWGVCLTEIKVPRMFMQRCSLY